MKLIGHEEGQEGPRAQEQGQVGSSHPAHTQHMFLETLPPFHFSRSWLSSTWPRLATPLLSSSPPQAYLQPLWTVLTHPLHQTEI